MPPREDFQAKLRKLRQEYAEILPVRLREIDLAWHKLKSNPAKTDLLKQLKGYVHTLAGSGATFGFPELGAQASRTEEQIDLLIEHPENPASRLPLIEEALRQLRKLAGQSSPSSAQRQEPKPEFMIEGAQIRRRMTWLGDDELYGLNMTRQLSLYGYLPTRLARMNEAVDLNKTTTDVLVIDLGGNLNLAEAETLLRQLGGEVPTICLCPVKKDTASWLRLIRAGASTCMDRPISIHPILEKLEPLTYLEDEDPFKLFIIDDDEILAGNIASIMEKAGMEVLLETDPVKVLQKLETWEPDLVLIDLHMPECDGLELARLIRQNDRFLMVPIVYLSAETQLNQQLAALEAGADDFILKPVRMRFLFHALSSRIRRARALRMAKERDVLTGLINHTCFQEELRQLLWKVMEQDQELVVALIDIDRFKAINDHHGHKTGDRLLRSLAIMLRRRFGDQARPARLDGGTFAMVLTGKTLEEVREALEEMRTHFNRVDHEAGIQLFEASFSGGLAHYPSYSSATDLVDACQKALFQAKSTGRGKIIIETPSAATPLPPVTISMTEAPTFPQISEEMREQFPDMDESDDGELIMIDDDEITLLEEGDTQPGDEDAPASATIVAVDDDRQLLGVVSVFLESRGYQVFTAPTGDEGFELALQHKPDLMLIDLLLFPGIHGFELCKKVKSRPELDHTKVILMTAVYKDYRYQVEGRQAGGDSFVIKPINFDELAEKISGLLGP